MSCLVNKFTITKELDNTFIFTIKADGSSLPMKIEVGDTFNAKLVKLVDNSTVLSKSLSIEDALNGKVSLTISSGDTSSLAREVGDKVDRYYIKPLYKLIIDCNTENNGKFIAKIAEVYVD